ncbi:MAG: CCA tRNA nucleotidyltransferase, partial [Planctomycetes bacterium]|nr:CCA tRNA nucleotidyltransferase [Planctomycetota bacterium]
METRPLACPSGPPWDDGVAVVRVLRDAGHESYLVGGCVRDLLLGRAVKDADVATAAHPEQVERCFARTIAVGRAFGVVVVVMPSGANVEVATFRHDGAYIDGRRPTSVQYGTSADDVERRDFTVNALLFDPIAGNVIDHVDGLSDLAARRLRAVGDAAARLREDRLRVLRALRFAAQLGLAIEPATWAAIRATPLTGLSGERIVQEWLKGLAGERRGDWLRLVVASGRMAEFSPPLAGTAADAIETTAARLDRLVEDDAVEVRAAIWLAAAPLTDALAWLDALPLPNALADGVRWLLGPGRDGAALLALDEVARWRLLQRAATRALARFQR